MSNATVEPPEYWEIEDVMRYFKVRSKRTIVRMNIPYAKIGGRRLYLPKDVARAYMERVS